MWKRLIVFSVFSVGLFCLAVYFAPPHWYRKSGVLDFVLVIDNSGSYEQAFPTAVKESSHLVNSVFPGDRLAAFAVGPEVLPLFNGTVSSPATRASIVRELRTLTVNTNGGTELAAVFAKVAKTYEEFAIRRSPHRYRRRLLVIFSDCVDTSADRTAFATAATMLPGRTSILVVGLQGTDRDAVTRALLGQERDNDLHVIPIEETPQAMRSVQESIMAAHPLKPLPVLAGVLLCALAGAGIAWGAGAIASGAARPLVVVLRRRGEEDTTQEFPLAEGDTLVIGSGVGAVDFCLPVSGYCSLARVGRELAVTPGVGRLVVRRRGIELPILDPIAVCDRDAIVLDSREVEVFVR